MKKFFIFILICGLLGALIESYETDALLEQYKKEIEQYKEENDNLKEEIEQYKEKNEKLNNEADKLKRTNKKLKDKNEELSNINNYENEENTKEYDDIPQEISNINNEEVITAYNNLPENVKKLFVNVNCKLYEVNDITSNYILIPYGTVGLFTYTTDGRCDIQVDIEKDGLIYNIEQTTYHEFGHLLDYGYNKEYESDDMDFMEIYINESEYLITDNYSYATSNSKEYFASCFAEYMMNPQQLKENNPRTYEYIENCINNIR